MNNSDERSVYITCGTSTTSPSFNMFYVIIIPSIIFLIFLLFLFISKFINDKSKLLQSLPQHHHLKLQRKISISKYAAPPHLYREDQYNNQIFKFIDLYTY
jgi:hypothetical protein